MCILCIVFQIVYKKDFLKTIIIIFIIVFAGCVG